MAGHNGKQALILGVLPARGDLRFAANPRTGAMGCGAYHCPPRQIAEEMKAILFDEEFVGWFKEVVFAVYPAGRTGETNYRVFKEVFGVSKS
jgi:hypothetical protein